MGQSIVFLIDSGHRSLCSCHTFCMQSIVKCGDKYVHTFTKVHYKQTINFIVYVCCSSPAILLIQLESVFHLPLYDRLEEPRYLWVRIDKKWPRILQTNLERFSCVLPFWSGGHEYQKFLELWQLQRQHLNRIQVLLFGIQYLNL